VTSIRSTRAPWRRPAATTATRSPPTASSFVSGKLPIAPDGHKLEAAPFEEQTRQVLDNVALALAAAGSSIDRLVQVEAVALAGRRTSA
jgi:enamine deaminase RidA (YjgF/YER057c/UK114 family)